MLAATIAIGRDIGASGSLCRRGNIRWDNGGLVRDLTSHLDVGKGLSDGGKTGSTKCFKAMSRGIKT